HLWIPPERNLEVRLHTHLGVRLSDVAATLASPVGALATENRGRDAAVDCHRREQHAAHHGCAPSQTLRGEELLAYAEVAGELVQWGVVEPGQHQAVDRASLETAVGER